MRIVVMGASGTAGQGVLQACLADAAVTEVRAPTRRPLGVAHPELRELLHRDFAELAPLAPAFEGVDLLCYCLGISASQVEGEAEYRRITFDYALAAAHALRAGSPHALFYFISGAGTSADSRMMWARVKGETELALQELGNVVCFRPGMILGADPQRQRPLGFRALQLLGRALAVIPSLAIENVAIGEGMLQAAREGRRDGIVDNRELRELARRYADALSQPAAGSSPRS